MSFPYGRSAIDQPFVYYVRRWERWLAIVSPKRRRKLKVMNAMLGKNLSEIQAMNNQIWGDLLLYGYSVTRYSHTPREGSIAVFKLKKDRIPPEE